MGNLIIHDQPVCVLLRINPVPHPASDQQPKRELSRLLGFEINELKGTGRNLEMKAFVH